LAASAQARNDTCTDGVLDPEGAQLAALRRLADFAGARVCEVGCGDGRLTTGIARDAATVFAFDPDAGKIAEARRRLPHHLRDVVTYEVGSAREIETPQGEFDIVVFSWSLCCMQRDGVVHALRRFREALAPGGTILDLQVVAPGPVVEVDGEVVCHLEGGSLLARAAAAAAVIDEEIARGLLREEGVDDHDVLRHFSTGASLVAHFRTRARSVPASAARLLEASARPHVVRETCRLRRLRRIS
jgi:SAM-dependent methyltransferase